MTVAVMREPTNAPRSNIPSPDTRRNVNLTKLSSIVLQVHEAIAVSFHFVRLPPFGTMIGG